MVDTPAIQYVVQEAVDSGLHDVLLVTGRNKNALENHFDRAAELEAQLEKKGDADKLAKVNFSTELADVHYVRQGDPKGLGHAVLRARPHVGNESFAVLLGDDIIDQRDTLLTKMLDVAEKEHTTVVALLEVDPSQIHLYGAAAVETTDDPDVVKITGLVEKPKAEDAPSNYAIIGRYVLRPEIFNILAHRAGQGRRDPADRRPPDDRRGAGLDGRRLRRRLPWPPLRHGRPSRLPEVDRANRHRP